MAAWSIRPFCTKKRCTLAVAAMGASLVFAGACDCIMPQDAMVPDPAEYPYDVQTAEVTVPRPDGSFFAAVIYYPVQANKENEPHARIAFPIPVITFGHARGLGPEACASTLECIAAQGNIVVAARSGMELFPDNQAFADDMSHCLSFMAAQTIPPDSQWYQQVDTARFAALGYSTGAATAILAAAADPRIKAVASIAPLDTHPSAIESAARLTVPFCLLAGTQDRIAPPQNNAMPVYGAAHAPKVSFGIEGGSHCGFADASTLFCDHASISRSDQLAVVAEKLVAFFDLYLRELPDARETLLAPSAPGTPQVVIVQDGVAEPADPP